MSTIIFSDQMTQPYSEWVTECLRVIADSDPKCIGITVISNSGDNMTGYWNADCADIGHMAQEVQADFIDHLVEANFSKHLANHGILVEDENEFEEDAEWI